MNAPAASGSGLLSELLKVGTYTVCHEWYGGSRAGQDSSLLRVGKVPLDFELSKTKFNLLHSKAELYKCP